MPNGQNQTALIEEVYFETVSEAYGHDATPLKAHMEGVIGAAMLLSALTGIEDEQARKQVVAMGLRPPSKSTH
jgi:hypothetical protein